MYKPALCIATIGLAGQAMAEAPNVAVDIAPVHSLVARVMMGVGEPSLIIPQTASPHHHAMRPSEARALQSADVVFWVGEELTPWMEKPLESLSGGAQTIALLDAEGTVLYEFRDVVEDDHDDHAGHDDHDDHAGHDDHDDHAGHDDHDDHAGHDDHDDHAGHDDHDDHAGHDDHGHSHEGVDPHAWLDPENARIWVQLIAETLAQSDPQNADLYRQNAKQASEELDAVSEQIAAALTDMQAQPFITFHDAYQYFEKRYGLETSGNVSLGDASAPGPARLSALQEKIADHNVVCAFAEPQFDTRLVETAIEGTSAKIYELDPVGVGLEPGAALYPELLLKMTESYSNCGANS